MVLETLMLFNPQLSRGSHWEAAVGSGQPAACVSSFIIKNKLGSNTWYTVTIVLFVTPRNQKL